MYLFDPVQLKQFGKEYLEGDGFSYRYQKKRRFGGILRNIYIPFGPILEDKKSLKDFFDNLSGKYLCKIVVDLPGIYNDKEIGYLKDRFLVNGFNERKYIQDKETILVTKEDYDPKSRAAQYCRKGNRQFRIEVKKSLDKEEMSQIFEIYNGLADRIGFEPKKKSALKVVIDNGLTSLAFNKETGDIEGFLTGYLMSTELRLEKFSLDKVDGKVLKLIFTGLTDFGYKKHVGYVLHSELFERAYENGVDVVDFHGADRSKGRKYVHFKKKWGGDFFQYPGSFEKFVLI